MVQPNGWPSSPRRRALRAGALTASVACLALTVAAAPPAYRSSPDAGGRATATSGTPDPTAPGPYRVASVAYDLGDSAFHDPDFDAPVELAAVVHYPRQLGDRPHPVVVQLHGMWWTCADRAAESAYKSALESGDDDALGAAADAMARWPCAPSVEPMPSERGYDYLGENLAGHGFVVVSIRADGINAGPLGDVAYAARAHLINAHLALWQRLVTTGGGPLAGRFVDPATGRPRRVDFRHHLDLTRVGTMGHSRGGAGVMWQAADKHRGEWPTGVRIKAVLPLAPVYLGSDIADMTDYTVTRVPFAVTRGTCDGAVGPGSFGYADDVRGRNKAPVYRLSIHGGNHNFFNTQWSPESGQVMAEDDAGPYGDPPQPGLCDARGVPDRQLTESQQRTVGTAYIAAFFRRHLLGDTRFAPMLTGRQHPMSHVAEVDATVQPPATRAP